jgi:orotidine-5'-phosphate decarboxylase
VAAVAEAAAAAVFLDLKLHDIPNTVAGAVRAVGGLGAAVPHGPRRGRAGDAGGGGLGRGGLATPPRLLAVTVLTSLDRDDLARTGVRGEPADQALLLASSPTAAASAASSARRRRSRRCARSSGPTR